MNEQAIMMLNAQTSATRYNIETWNMILNLDGLSWSQMQLDALKICQAIAEVEAGHYPERLGTMTIINAPSSFACVRR